MEKPDSRRTKALGCAQGEVDNAPEEVVERMLKVVEQARCCTG